MEKLNLKEIDRISCADPALFLSEYYQKNIPCILTDFAKDWSAIKKWNPEYFKKSYGNNIVKVYDSTFADAGKSYMASKDEMKFSDYLDRIEHGENLRMFLYNIFSHAPELKQDISLPKFIKGLSKRFLLCLLAPKTL